jgi:hypothetical protein
MCVVKTILKARNLERQYGDATDKHANAHKASFVVKIRANHGAAGKISFFLEKIVFLTRNVYVLYLHKARAHACAVYLNHCCDILLYERHAEYQHHQRKTLLKYNVRKQGYKHTYVLK